MPAMKAGIYIIQNSADGKVYVGSAANLHKRQRNHLNGLKRGKHENARLQRAWLKHGSESFVFRVLLYCAVSDLLWFEQRALDRYKDRLGGRGMYNLNPLAGSGRGYEYTLEQREVRREQATGNKHSLGHKNHLGHRHSPEARAKISAAMKRARAKNRNGSTNGYWSFLGHKHSEESRKKISIAMAGKSNRRGAQLSDETKAKISASVKAYFANKAALMCLLLLLLAVPAMGQTSASSAQDDPVAKALEQAVNRLAVAEEQKRLLEDRLAAKDEIIKAKDGTIAIRDQQLELALSANKDRAGANVIDAFRVEACQQQLAKADAEIARLRNPGFLKSLFDVKSITGAVVGFGLGRATK